MSKATEKAAAEKAAAAKKKAARKAPPKAPRETKAVDADKAAESVKGKDDLERLIIKEACLLSKGERIDLQNLTAYAKQFMKRGGKPTEKPSGLADMIVKEACLVTEGKRVGIKELLAYTKQYMECKERKDESDD